MGTRNSTKDFYNAVASLQKDDHLRNMFMKACMLKLGFKAGHDSNMVLSLSYLHLSSSQAGDIERLLDKLKDIIIIEKDKKLIKDEHDTFYIRTSDPWSDDISSQEAQKAEEEQPHGQNELTDIENRIIESERNKPHGYDSILKMIWAYKTSIPPMSDINHFDHKDYFRALKEYQTQQPGASSSFGQVLLYGDVVTSTNTLLEA